MGALGQREGTAALVSSMALEGVVVALMVHAQELVLAKLGRVPVARAGAAA
jgi:hypothetical protein